MEVVLALLVLWGGYEYSMRDTEEQSNAVEVELVDESGEPEVETQPVFARGEYFLSEFGYFISDLSAKPKPTPGCGEPILVTDLTTSSRSDTGLKLVQKINVECEG